MRKLTPRRCLASVGSELTREVTNSPAVLASGVKSPAAIAAMAFVAAIPKGTEVAVVSFPDVARSVYVPISSIERLLKLATPDLTLTVA